MKRSRKLFEPGQTLALLPRPDVSDALESALHLPASLRRQLTGANRPPASSARRGNGRPRGEAVDEEILDESPPVLQRELRRGKRSEDTDVARALSSNRKVRIRRASTEREPMEIEEGKERREKGERRGPRASLPEKPRRAKNDDEVERRADRRMSQPSGEEKPLRTKAEKKARLAMSLKEKENTRKGDRERRREGARSKDPSVRPRNVDPVEKDMRRRRKLDVQKPARTNAEERRTMITKKKKRRLSDESSRRSSAPSSKSPPADRPARTPIPRIVHEASSEDEREPRLPAPAKLQKRRRLSRDGEPIRKISQKSRPTVLNREALKANLKTAEAALSDFALSDKPIPRCGTLTSVCSLEFGDISVLDWICPLLLAHAEAANALLSSIRDESGEEPSPKSFWSMALKAHNLESEILPFLDRSSEVARMFWKVSQAISDEYAAGHGHLMDAWYNNKHISRRAIDFVAAQLNLWTCFVDIGRSGDRRAPRKRTVELLLVGVSHITNVELDPFGRHWFSFTGPHLSRTFVSLLSGKGTTGIDVFVRAFVTYIETLPSQALRLDRLKTCSQLIVGFLALLTMDPGTTLPHLRGMWGACYPFVVSAFERFFRSKICIELIPHFAAHMQKKHNGLQKMERLHIMSLSVILKNKSATKLLMSNDSAPQLLFLLQAVMSQLQFAASDPLGYIKMVDRHPDLLEMDTELEVVKELLSTMNVQTRIMGSSDPEMKKGFLPLIEDLVISVGAACRHQVPAENPINRVKTLGMGTRSIQELQNEEEDDRYEDYDVLRAIGFVVNIISNFLQSPTGGGKIFGENTLRTLLKCGQRNSRRLGALLEAFYKIRRFGEFLVGWEIVFSRETWNRFLMAIEAVRLEILAAKSDKGETVQQIAEKLSGGVDFAKKLVGARSDSSGSAPPSGEANSAIVFPGVLDCTELVSVAALEYRPFEDDPHQQLYFGDHLMKKHGRVLARYDPSFKKPSKWVRLSKNEYIGDARQLLSKDEKQRYRCGCKPGATTDFDAKEINCSNSSCTNVSSQIECDAKTCPAGSSCQNQRMQRDLRPAFKKKYFGAKGFGLVADEDINENTFIGEYRGEVLPTKEFEKRKRSYVGERHFYTMALTSKLIIDASRKSSITRFINHSCEPNTRADKWTAGGEPRIALYSSKKIPKGTEITFDYDARSGERESKRCLCESKGCRGTLTKEEEGNVGVAKVPQEKIGKAKASYQRGRLMREKGSAYTVNQNPENPSAAFEQWKAKYKEGYGLPNTNMHRIPRRTEAPAAPKPSVQYGPNKYLQHFSLPAAGWGFDMGNFTLPNIPSSRAPGKKRVFQPTKSEVRRARAAAKVILYDSDYSEASETVPLDHEFEAIEITSEAGSDAEFEEAPPVHSLVRPEPQSPRTPPHLLLGNVPVPVDNRRRNAGRPNHGYPHPHARAHPHPSAHAAAHGNAPQYGSAPHGNRVGHANTRGAHHDGSHGDSRSAQRRDHQYRDRVDGANAYRGDSHAPRGDFHPPRGDSRVHQGEQRLHRADQQPHRGPPHRQSYGHDQHQYQGRDRDWNRRSGMHHGRGGGNYRPYQPHSHNAVGSNVPPGDVARDNYRPHGSHSRAPPGPPAPPQADGRRENYRSHPSHSRGASGHSAPPPGDGREDYRSRPSNSRGAHGGQVVAAGDAGRDNYRSHPSYSRGAPGPPPPPGDVGRDNYRSHQSHARGAPGPPPPPPGHAGRDSYRPHSRVAPGPPAGDAERTSYRPHQPHSRGAPGPPPPPPGDIGHRRAAPRISSRSPSRERYPNARAPAAGPVPGPSSRHASYPGQSAPPQAMRRDYAEDRRGSPRFRRDERPSHWFSGGQGGGHNPHAREVEYGRGGMRRQSVPEPASGPPVVSSRDRRENRPGGRLSSRPDGREHLSPRGAPDSGPPSPDFARMEARSAGNEAFHATRRPSSVSPARQPESKAIRVSSVSPPRRSENASARNMYGTERVVRRVSPPRAGHGRSGPDDGAHVRRSVPGPREAGHPVGSDLPAKKPDDEKGGKRGGPADPQAVSGDVKSAAGPSAQKEASSGRPESEIRPRALDSSRSAPPSQARKLNVSNRDAGHVQASSNTRAALKSAVEKMEVANSAPAKATESGHPELASRTPDDKKAVDKKPVEKKVAGRRFSDSNKLVDSKSATVPSARAEPRSSVDTAPVRVAGDKSSRPASRSVAGPLNAAVSTVSAPGTSSGPSRPRTDEGSSRRRSFESGERHSSRPVGGPSAGPGRDSGRTSDGGYRPRSRENQAHPQQRRRHSKERAGPSNRRKRSSQGSGEHEHSNRNVRAKHDRKDLRNMLSKRK